MSDRKQVEVTLPLVDIPPCTINEFRDEITKQAQNALAYFRQSYTNGMGVTISLDERTDYHREDCNCAVKNWDFVVRGWVRA